METFAGDLNLAASSVAALGQQMKLLAQGESLYAAFGKIPDTRLLCPQSTEEWEIQTFNLKMEIPSRFSTVDQVGDWVNNCAFLNREVVGGFLTEPGHEPVLEYIARHISHLNEKNGLVDNLKVFFAVVGALETESLENGPERIQTLLEYFANGFCEYNKLEIKDPLLIADISYILLKMSTAMHSGRKLSSLQNFLADIRAMNSSLAALPSRAISDIYHDFAAIGPFKRIAGRPSPEYLLMRPLRSEWMTVFFGFNDNEPTDYLVSVSKSVIYLFSGEEKTPIGCIPLEFVSVSLSRLLQWTIELYSCHGASVPFVKFDKEEYYTQKISGSDIVSIQSILLRIPDQSIEILHSWFDLIEGCCWKCRQPDDGV